LETYFKQPIFDQLAHVFQRELNPLNQTAFRLRYGGNYDGLAPWNLEQIAQQLEISQQQLETNLTQSRHTLEQAAMTMLQETAMIIPQEKISELVEQWLREQAIYSRLTPLQKQT
jgi:hypothetical protein